MSRKKYITIEGQERIYYNPANSWNSKPTCPVCFKEHKKQSEILHFIFMLKKQFGYYCKFCKTLYIPQKVKKVFKYTEE